MNWQAKWIWADIPERKPTNQSCLARKSFELPAFSQAKLYITADTQYRVYLNGEGIEDGPCRSWPEHYQYDVIDVTPWLKEGKNVIAVWARFFGGSTFHQLPQEAGLLAQLEVTSLEGETLTIATDETWRMRVDESRPQNTARSSIQMEKTEYVEAAKEPEGWQNFHFDDSDWPFAKAYYEATAGPWQDLHPRDVRFLTKEPIFARGLCGLTVVEGVKETFCVDLHQLCYPGDTSANSYPQIGVLATVVHSDKKRSVEVEAYSFNGRVFCRGREIEGSTLELEAGDNLVVLLVQNGGHNYDFSLSVRECEGLELRNPLDESAATPWVWIGPFGARTRADVEGFPNTVRATGDYMPELLPYGQAPDVKAFAKLAGDKAQVVPPEYLLKDAYPAFLFRKPLHSAEDLLKDADHLLSDTSEVTLISPSEAGDVELCLDFGREVVGYVELEFTAAEGTVVDAFLIEYREGENLQHTVGNRNGFRYVAKEGLNRFRSCKRRAGRYLFLTFRNLKAPVAVRKVALVQATYPVAYKGGFFSSDAALNRIWEMSAYTLRLCMEDTFTDCPLYEQTLWVGDARNESLYNFICFGASDLSLRCLRLVAQSLDYFPMVGAQLPSGWETLLPAWSFMWGMNVWEYYFSTGDAAGLKELYPAVIANLKGAESFCTDRGLFSLEAWNMFDWAGIDDNHKTVIHNSLFLVGAIQAARKCCRVLGEGDEAWLADFEARLKAAILPLWDYEKGSYPDAILEDGSISDSISAHTSVLALLYDVVPDDARERALQNVISPPEGMVQVGSPFALQYFLEALEKEGKAKEALKLVREKWQDMLESGATTCWETFRGQLGSSWPTRSHCHAWSSGPLYVFNRLLLGLVPTAPEAAEVVVSPHPVGVTHAKGGSWSPKGELQVSWRLEAGTLYIEVNVPEGVAWRVEPNVDWQGLKAVVVNGEARPDLLQG